MKEMTPAILQSCYYSIFATEQGGLVLNDLKRILTGKSLDEYEGVNPALPYNELAAKTATRNAWDMIDGMTQEVEVSRKSFSWLVKETFRIYKYSRRNK
jgi:hypothetical protein